MITNSLKASNLEWILNHTLCFPVSADQVFVLQVSSLNLADSSGITLLNDLDKVIIDYRQHLANRIIILVSRFSPKFPVWFLFFVEYNIIFHFHLSVT